MVAVVQVSGLPFPEVTNTNYATGSWYTTPMGAWLNQASCLVNGAMTLVPFVPRATHTFTGIGWFHNSAAQTGHNIRLGVYGSTNGKPSGSPIVDSGSIATTAAVAFRSATGLSIPLTAGQIYWLAANADATLAGLAWNTAVTSNMQSWAPTGLIDPATAFTNGLSNSYLGGYTQAAAFGALPAIGTLVDNAIVTAYPVVIMLQA